MPFKNKKILERSDPFNFKENATLGWQCHCGAIEKLPVLTSDLKTIEKPILIQVSWFGCTKTFLIQCMMCGCQGREISLHATIDSIEKGHIR